MALSPLVTLEIQAWSHPFLLPPLSWKSFSSFNMVRGREITNEMHTKWAHYFEFTINCWAMVFFLYALAVEIVRKIIHSPTFLQHLCIGLLGQIRGSHFHRSAQIGSAWTFKNVQPNPTRRQLSSYSMINDWKKIVQIQFHMKNYLAKPL